MRFVWTVLRITLFFLIGSVLARADEGPTSRRVTGGDILQSAKGLGSSPDEAIFRAQSEAVKALAIECGAPLIGITIFDKRVGAYQDRYVAQVQAGIDFDACEAGKRASPEARKRLTNPILEKDLKAYDRLLSDGASDPGELREYLEQEFGGLHDSIDGVNHRIDELQYRLAESSTSVQMPVPTSAPPQAQRSDLSGCRVQYQALMAQANAAALENTPPGNLATGRAAVLMNQAQTVVTGCQ